MTIRWDALLVRELARELDQRLAGSRLRAIRLDGSTREATLLFREATLRWPLHPMGFVAGIGFGWRIWGPALVGWLAKWLTVRYGGATTYRLVRPFFLGLIFGEICMRFLWGGVALWQGQLGMGFPM